MTWFRIDDGFYDHPKVVTLEDGKLFAPAIALWTLAGCWAARQLTDGHVPARQVRKLGFAPKHAAALVDAGLWSEADGGWQFHEWTAHQPSREEVESKREADRIRKAEARAKAAESRRRPKVVRADVQPESPGSSVLPGPARPDPTRDANASNPPTPQGAGLWSSKFDPSRASEYLVPLATSWGGPTPKLRLTQQRDVAERLHAWCEGMTESEAAARLATLGPWSRRKFQPADKVRLLLTGDLDAALTPDAGASGYTEPADHAQFGEGVVKL